MTPLFHSLCLCYVIVSERNTALYHCYVLDKRLYPSVLFDVNNDTLLYGLQWAQTCRKSMVGRGSTRSEFYRFYARAQRNSGYTRCQINVLSRI